MPTPLGTIEKEYPAQGNFRLYRLEESTSFTCSRCSQTKQSKLVAICDNDWNKCVCNSCYGFLFSNNTDDSPEENSGGGIMEWSMAENFVGPTYEKGRSSSDKLLSLCLAVIRGEGYLRLLRIADVEEGELKPYHQVYSPRYSGTNTQYIYPNPNEPIVEGEIGFWSWYSPDGERQLSYRDMSNRWIDVLRIDNVTDTESLRLAFFDGIDIDIERRYLIEFAVYDNVSQCVYCDSSCFRSMNNKYVLKDDIYSLRTYGIPKDDVHPIRTTDLPDSSMNYYGYMVLPESIGSFLVRTPIETVRKAIRARINKCTDGFSKQEKAIIRRFVSESANEIVVNSIVAECKCSTEEAQQYLEEFIKHCEEHFTADDFDESVMLRLVSSDSEIGLKYKKAIHKDWESQNAALIETVDKEYRLAKENRDRIYTEIEELEVLAKEVSENFEAVKKDYSDNVKLADGIAGEIRSRIATATEDLSKFLAQYSLFLPTAKRTGNSEKILYYVRGTDINSEPDETKQIEILDNLKENLEAIGVKDRSKCAALGAYMLAAYSLRVPLIIAGFGAELIADALSATLFNRTSDKIYAGNVFEHISVDSDRIVIVYDGFGIMNKVVSSFGKQFVCFLAQTSEELFIEPRSLYNYALPIFADYYISYEQDPDGIYGAIFKGDINYVARERKTKIPNGVLPPFALNRLNKLVGTATELYSDLTEYDTYSLAVMPIMLSVSKRDELIEMIQSSSFSDGEKTLLFELMGETQ